MRQSEVPVYNDPVDFENGDNKYPCSTQYMVYNALDHKYYLTEEALNYYGIDVERKYINDVANKTEHFIKLVTKKVYDLIYYRAGYQLYRTQQYRIATAPKKLYEDQYTFRKTFEDILITEALWLINNGDSAQYSAYDLEKGEQKGVKPEEDWDNLKDISPEVGRQLQALGLTRWFTLTPNARIDNSKF